MLGPSAMPLHLLRPHRRTKSSSAPLVPPADPRPPLPTFRSVANAPPQVLSALPPLDIGSPDLGSPGQWLDQDPTRSSSTVATTAVHSPSTFSRTSTPGTALTAPSEPSRTPLPAPPMPNKPAPPLVRAPAQPSTSRPPTATAYTVTVSGTPGKEGAAKEKDGKRERSSTRGEKSTSKAKEKMNRLNPMALLRRRSSQNVLANAEKTDDFDPGIIYATRHPDWSMPAKRRPDVLVTTIPFDKRLSREETPKTPAFKEQFGEETAGAVLISEPPSITVSPQPSSRPATATTSPQISTATAGSETVVLGSEIKTGPPSVNEGSGTATPEAVAESSLRPTLDGRRGVTLVDAPLGVPAATLARSSSRFSFEMSTVASPAGSVKENVGGRTRPTTYASSEDPDDNFEFDLDEMEDDGFEKANEGLFGGYEEEETMLELQQAVHTLQLPSPQAHDTTMIATQSIGPDVDEQPEEDIGLAMTKDSSLNPTARNSGLDLPAEIPPTMEPQPKIEKLTGSRKRLRIPKGMDICHDDSDFDFIDDEKELAGYEDDDDMYFDDGIIVTQRHEQDEPEYMALVAEPPPLSPPLTIDTSISAFPNGQESPANPRDSMITHPVTSGGVQDGSRDSTVDSGPSLPPFLNPVGGSLGYQQFYAPPPPHSPGDNSLLTNYALTNLNYTLQALQAQQQAQQTSHSSPLEGYESENDLPDFTGGSYFPSDVDLDLDFDSDAAMVAAANAEALASDESGFYGREFGLYAGMEQNAAGGKRLPLTPISERSENSYRNSLVFPNGGVWGAGGLTTGEDEMTLGQLLRLRKNAWGGSNASMKSSNASSPVSLAGQDGSPNGASGMGWSPERETALKPPPGLAPPPGFGNVPTNASPLGSTPPGFPSTDGPAGLVSSPLSYASPPSGMIDPPPRLVQYATVNPGLSQPDPSPNLVQFATTPGMSAPPGLSQTLPPPPPGLSQAVPSAPPGLAGPPGLPPGLAHAGANAMLPTKGSFEDPLMQAQSSSSTTQLRAKPVLQPAAEIRETESSGIRQSEDSCYGSAVGSPIAARDRVVVEI